MENLIVNKKIKRSLDGSFYVEWIPLNEEIQDLAIHGANFQSKEHILEYEMYAHNELVNCINAYFGQNLYQVNSNSVEHSLYIKRKEDGIQAVNALMAELRNTALKLNLPETVNPHIENVLKDVKQDIESGWWKSALDKINNVQPDSYVSIELINRIKNTIENYIINNYSITFV